METIVIGKPAINVYMALKEYPSEGDLFTINSKIESLGNVGATSACLLSKWNLKPHFTGVIGNDSYGEKVRNILTEHKVNIKYIEQSYTMPTSTNYLTLNTGSGVVTKVAYNDPNTLLERYKYDFNPEFGIIDGTDYAGGLALINNNPNIPTVLYARIADKDTVIMSKRCGYVVCTEAYATGLTHMELDGSAALYVNMYQKMVDACGKSNFIVILNNHKILYSENGQVKMLPEMKINVADYSSFDSIFVGAFSFALINNVDINTAVKFANTAAALSLTKIGEVDAIPELEDVLNNSGLKEKFGVKENVYKEAEAQEITPLNPNINVNVNQTPDKQEQEQVSVQNTEAQEQVQPQQVVEENQPSVQNQAFASTPVPKQPIDGTVVNNTTNNNV